MPRPSPRARLAAAAVVAALVAAACLSEVPRARGRARHPTTSTTTAAPDVSSTGFTPAPLEWESCSAGECATLRVPLDYSKPAGRTIGLRVARAQRASSDRLGALVANPGGPGASGLDILDYLSAQLPSEITDRFDLVAWDPRGAGASEPVDCGTDLDARFAVDSSPDDPNELAALEAAAKRFVDECVQRSGDLLRHISTADTVRDLDVLRAALGEERLTYVGYSYGTLIGARYAEAFPTRVRALVLDGAIDPTRPVEDIAIQQAQGFDASLARFFAWCAGRRSCEFHGGRDGRDAYHRLVAQIDANPIGAGSRRFGPTQLDVAVAALLYSGAEGYTQLAGGLHALENGNAGPLLAIFDFYVGRQGGSYDAEWPAFIAISCADGPNLTLAQTEALQQRAELAAPEFGAGNIGLGFECASWPYPPQWSAPTPAHAATATPIMVVGTRGDPATPFAWAEGLAAQLGNARLVAVDDSTHTATLNGNACLDRILTRYLVDLVPPLAGATC